jgi:OOP family OmpA-OmpF porin
MITAPPRLSPLLAAVALALVAPPVAAQAPAAPPDAPAATPAPAPTPAAEQPTPWIKRYRPERNSLELGVYGGVFLPSTRHEFYKADLQAENFGHQPYARAGADIGLRVGYYPLRVLGLELEGGVMPIKVADGTRATLYTFRPVVVAQLPYRIAPFVRAGFGLLGTSSLALGKDVDPTLNIGGGVKFYVNRLIALRLDVVDNIATAFGVGNDRSNNVEVTLGLSVRLGKQETPAPRPLVDSDHDGLYDPGQPGVAAADTDACPTDPGPRDNRGCPWVDSDGDGLWDPGQGGVAAADEDACPQQPGPRDNRGCPLVDSDGDGLYDPGQPVAAADTDECPQEPGPRELQGCPDRDQDKIVDKRDKCPDQPEVYNQIDDADGCPDEIPKAVKKMAGVLEGIYFDVDKDTIKPRSIPILDKAVKVLTDYPSTRWRITGHTDADGTREHNLDLSERRAAAVKKYLIDHGVDEKRLESQGFGPDQPIDTNSTRAGKAKNRRIEFQLVD